MSTELNKVEEDRASDEVHLTSFFGGTDRGRCVQLTQGVLGDVAMIQVTERQAAAMISVLGDWIANSNSLSDTGR